MFWAVNSSKTRCTIVSLLPRSPVMGPTRPLLSGLHSSNQASTQLPLVSAWLQYMLQCSSRSMHTSNSSLQQQQQSRAGGRGQGRQPQQQQQQQQSQHAGDQQAQPDGGSGAYVFSIRPSVLSPLHPYFREIQDERQRLDLLQRTLQAQLKLAEEIQPQQLGAHAGSPDPVAAALAARRAAVQQVADSFTALMRHHIFPEITRDNMGACYAMMEGVLKCKDQDVRKFQEVVEGKEDVWQYWFQHFAKNYEGLPSLGTLESIYNQQDEEEMAQKLRELQASAPKGPRQPQVDHLGRAAAVGGRKTSVARVFIWKGQGRILVNRKPLDAFFRDVLMRSHVLKPLMTTGLVDKMDVLVHVQGGGVSGQAQAAAHGIAKALVRLDPSLKPTLKAQLRRDPRAVERKKPGKAKARKAFAWVKR